MNFHLLYIPDEQPSLYWCLSSVESLVAQLKTLDLSRGRLRIFYGHELRITAGPFRYLAMGTHHYPLFDVPTPGPLASDDLSEEPVDAEYARLTPKQPASPPEVSAVPVEVSGDHVRLIMDMDKSRLSAIDSAVSNTGS